MNNIIDWRRALRAVLFIPALIVVGIVWVLRPLFLVRFGQLDSARIGHLAGNTEVYLAERELGLHPKGFFGGVDLWAHHCTPCNAQLAKMIGRQVLVDPAQFVLFCSGIIQSFHFGKKHIAKSINWDRDIHNAMEKTRQHIQFTKKEIELGDQQLRHWGVPQGAKYVCIVARDDAYVPLSYEKKAFSYHGFRNSRISTYRKAALGLAKRGYHVFRMGSVVKSRFDVDSDMVADYATNGMRSDFMDIYLMAHCTFAVTNGCGLDNIASIFRKPLCMVNHSQLEYLLTWCKGLTIWKHMYKDGKELSWHEIWNCGAGAFMRNENFKDAGITIKDNTAQEIYDAAMQMADIVEGQHKPDSKMQKQFWHCYPSGSVAAFNGLRIHGEIRMRIGEKFLEETH